MSTFGQRERATRAREAPKRHALTAEERAKVERVRERMRLFREVVEEEGGILHGLSWDATYADIEREREARA